MLDGKDATKKDGLDDKVLGNEMKYDWNKNLPNERIKKVLKR